MMMLHIYSTAQGYAPVYAIQQIHGGGIYLVEDSISDRLMAALPYVELQIEDDIVVGFELTERPSEIQTLRAAALSRIEGCCSTTVASGVTVNGKCYPLTTLAQLDLKALADAGKDDLYHAAGEAQRLYTAAEFAAIAAVAKEWATVNTTYYDLLKAWVARETDADKLGAIKYDSKLPDDLMTQLADLCKSVGIDVTKYTALFTA